MGMPMPMFLPRGIVVNTDHIYDEVAGYSVVPLEKIYEFWHVYTTTQRQLFDPTALRLENFWWHVWGSNRRHLSGRELARLYENISTGPSFAPLRCPPNRYEGPLVPRFSQHESDKPHPAQRPRPELVQQSKSSDSSQVPSRDHTPSSSKPPPPHPILKKARGPSTSGPRPTARFVSPHGSDDEDSKGGGDVSSGSTATTGVDLRPTINSASPAKSDRRSTPTKKFVAASKRRPVLPRRPSSQSSVGSDAGSREGSSAGSRYATSQRLAPPAAEQLGRSPQSASSGSSVHLSGRSPLGSKAAGKRPVPRPPNERRISGRSNPRHLEHQARPAAAQPDNAVQTVPQSPPPGDVRLPLEAERAQGAAPVPGALPAAAPAERPGGEAKSSPMIRSKSNVESYRPREVSLGRAPPHGLVASSVAATSNVAVQGTFDFENINPPAPTDFPGFGEDHGTSGLASRPSASSLLEARFTPTQPSPTPAVPLGRSKSQLTLLLEREKARIGDIKSPRGAGGREKK